jgi:hypothetical protein
MIPLPCGTFGVILAGKFWELFRRRALVTLDSYRLLEATAVCAGEAWESAIVAQLVPAAEIH